MRFALFAPLIALALAACVEEQPLRLGTDGKPIPRLYRIEDKQEAAIQYRVLDSVNTLRATAGLAPLNLHPALIASAKTHARDMAAQNRPWHFGSDGSSPIDRARRAGYPGALKGEALSETFENEVETLSAWMAEQGARGVILDAEARDLGFGWYQEPAGKIWWTLVTGG